MEMFLAGRRHLLGADHYFRMGPVTPGSLHGAEREALSITEFKTIEKVKSMLMPKCNGYKSTRRRPANRAGFRRVKGIYRMYLGDANALSDCRCCGGRRPDRP